MEQITLDVKVIAFYHTLTKELINVVTYSWTNSHICHAQLGVHAICKCIPFLLCLNFAQSSISEVTSTVTERITHKLPPATPTITPINWVLLSSECSVTSVVVAVVASSVMKSPV